MSRILWIRLGDADGYEEFGDDLSAVVDALKSAGVSAKFTGVRGGISASGFEGRNYISMYWGDSDANHIRDLNKTELSQIRKGLKR